VRAISGKDFAKLLEKKGWELRRIITSTPKRETQLEFLYPYLEMAR